MNNTDLRASWFKAAKTLLFPVFVILFIRWALFEPYIIPSGSMLPNLHIYDHVLVNKFRYGLRLPFAKQYVLNWSSFKRGDVIVFRYPKDENIFYVKRVIGLPGEKISWQGHQVFINGEKIEQIAQSDNQYLELNWLLQYHSNGYVEDGEYEIQKDEVFVMGDHRDNSSDSRVWGAVKINLVLGQVSRIWMACDKMLDPSIRLCDPRTIKWNRIGNKL
jgi:signal peptidase I